MLINRENMSALFKNIKTTFQKALGEATPVWPEVASEIASTSSMNDYSWIKDNWPGLRKWIGDKVVKALGVAKYVVHNEPYEATIGVKRDDLEDDQTGAYAARVKAHGDAAAAWADELVAEQLNGAFVKECWDGQYFIDTDHPVGDGVASNKGVVVLSGATQALANASLGAAMVAMTSQKNDEGRPLAINPNVLVVPPALRIVANMLMTSDRLEDGKPNPYKGMFKVVVWARLTSATAWFLMDTTKAIKPLIFQPRKKPVLVEQKDPNSDSVFQKGQFLISVEARGAAAYGFWQLIWGSTGAGA